MSIKIFNINVAADTKLVVSFFLFSPSATLLLVLWESLPLGTGWEEEKVKRFWFLTQQEIAFSNAFNELWSLFNLAEIWKLLCNYQQSELCGVFFPSPRKAGIKCKSFHFQKRKKYFFLFILWTLKFSPLCSFFLNCSKITSDLTFYLCQPSNPYSPWLLPLFMKIPLGRKNMYLYKRRPGEHVGGSYNLMYRNSKIKYLPCFNTETQPAA